MRRWRGAVAGVLVAAVGLCVVPAIAGARGSGDFRVEEATIDDIQDAIKRRQVTTSEIVEAYLERIKAYNGTCVNQPDGLLGPISTIQHAGKINALLTLNLRPDAREEWGFDARKARSMTDSDDDDPDMPDALETAARLDRQFARTRRLAGPLHGVVMAIKDQYDTFDLRTTSGADAFWANDRPPDDATFVKRLRDAGAIILAKANMGEYAAGGITGTRSSFGGTMCNPYDTERDPGASSGGSGMAVAANLVTCAIGEETGTSVREPAKNNNAVGIAPTRELVSADGMIQEGITTRVGPICRTVGDTARILDAYAGFDPADELTSFSVGRTPAEPYHEFERRHLRGYRLGVIREYMNKELFTVADAETIDIVDRAIRDLRRLGATIVDPGPGGALFQSCVDRYVPRWQNQQFMPQFPALFPVDAAGEPASDHIATLLDMFFDTSLVPHTSNGRPSIRNLGGVGGADDGDGRFNFNMYIRERGDANIGSLTDLIEKANHWSDPAMPSRRPGLENTDEDRTLANAGTLQTRFTLQTVVHQCFAEMDLDAVVYPTGNVPPAILTAPQEPTVNDRSSGLWTYINSRGFPAMTVPAGFTTHVYDRAGDGSLLPAEPARLPVGIDFLGLPFSEPTLFAIASAYEDATEHREPPADFGPLDSRGRPSHRIHSSEPRPMPQGRRFRADELRAIEEN
jgi:amidase